MSLILLILVGVIYLFTHTCTGGTWDFDNFKKRNCFRWPDKKKYAKMQEEEEEEEEEQEEEGENEDDKKPNFYENGNGDSYFSDEVVDCQETVAGYDECVTVGQDLVTILQYPMNGGKACTEKICRNIDVYNCRARGKEREVFIQRRSDNKFLNYTLVPCADYDDICCGKTTLTDDKINEFKCKNTNINRIKNSEDVKWDIKIDWEDYNVVGYASSWILKILPIDDNSNRDSFHLYMHIKSDENKLDKLVYLTSPDNNNVLDKNVYKLSYDPFFFQTHISEGSEGINLLCQEDNTQLIVYEPVHKACTTLGEVLPFMFIKRKSDGKYLVVKGPKLLDYYADRVNASDYEFGLKGLVMERINTTSFHEFCIDGDNYHISYTDDINKATSIIIEKSDTTISLKLEYEVTNFELVGHRNWQTWPMSENKNIDNYKDPHKVTKYLELVDGNISLCNNWKYTKWTYPEKDYVDTKVIGLRPENAPDIPLEDAKGQHSWVGTWWNTPDDIICEVHRDPIDYDIYDRPNKWEDPETTCFYGSQDKIDISTDLFEQNYELESNTTMRIGTEPKNCKVKTEQEQECEKDYKKCNSFEEFFPYHGNKTDYSFGKCVPKTTFINQINENDELSNDLIDIVTKRCDQSINCNEGMQSSNIFTKDDTTINYEYLKSLIPSGVHPALKQTKLNRANWVTTNILEPIKYSDACTSKTE